MVLICNASNLPTTVGAAAWPMCPGWLAAAHAATR